MRKLMLLSGTATAIALIALMTPQPHAQSFGAPAGTVPAPDPNVPLYFEAASVKPSDPGNPPGQGIRRQPGGRFNTFNRRPACSSPSRIRFRAISSSADQRSG